MKANREHLSNVYRQRRGAHTIPGGGGVKAGTSAFVDFFAAGFGFEARAEPMLLEIVF
jgi:hypothetical protein